MTRLEAQLRLSRRAEERQRRLMQIAGCDLLRSLGVITAILDRSLRDERADAGRQRLETALEAADRLKDGLRLLTPPISQPAGALAEPAPLPIRALLDEVGLAWRLEAVAKGLRLAIMPSTRVAVTDSALLSAALNILVGHAVRNTIQGGVVVGCRREAGAAALCVYDTGPGLPLDDLEAVFEISEAGASSFEGLGRELAVVHSVTAFLGYGLRVRSWPGRGTCFAITRIPCDV